MRGLQLRCTDPVLELVGTPYADRGQWPNGLDCFTCAREAMRRMGLAMPALEYDESREVEQAALVRFARHFEPIESPERGAFVLFRENHCGVCVDAQSIIHCKRATGTVVQRIESLRPLIFGFWRLRAEPLADDVDDAEVMRLVQVPGEPVTTGIVYALISAAISAGLSYAISALFPAPDAPKTRRDKDSSSTYSWSGISTQFEQGNPVQVVYGEHRLGGQVVALHRRNVSESKANHLFMLIALGYGTFERIGNYTQDMNYLVPKGTGTETFNEVYSDLQVPGINHPKWFRRWGSSGAIESTGTVASKGGTGGYSFRDDIGLMGDNWRISGDFLTVSGGSYIAMAGNLEDIDNYHAVYAEDNGAGGYQLKVIARNGGANTTLHTENPYTLGDRVTLWRYDDVLHLEVNGTEVAVFDADATLNSSRTGLVAVGGGAATFDNWQVSGAMFLPRGLEINGVEANSYTEVRAWIRHGRERQERIGDDFKKIIHAYSPDVLLMTTWTEYAVHTEIEGFQVNLDFPRGLYDQTSGTIASNSVVVAVEYRPNPSAAWTPITGSPFTITDTETGPFTRTIDYQPMTPLSGAEQQIRVRRIGNSARILGESRAQDEVRLADINEIEGSVSNDAYSGIALIGLRMQASDQLSGGVPNVTCLCRGLRVPTWNGSSGSSTAPRLFSNYSTNPAWIAADILLNKTRGLGNWYGPDRIDWPAMYAWAQWCDEQETYREPNPEPAFVTNDTEAVSGGSVLIVLDSTDAAQFNVNGWVQVELEMWTRVVAKTDLGGGRTQLTLLDAVERTYGAGWTLYKLTMGPLITDTRHEFNGVFDSGAATWESLQQVCMVGRAIPMQRGDVFTVRYESDAEPVQIFTDAGTESDSLEITYLGRARQVDAVDVQFLNADKAYEQEIASAPPAAFIGQSAEQADRAAVREVVSRYGITSARQARREAYYLKRMRQRARKMLRDRMPLNAVTAEPGDIIGVQARFAEWGYWGGLASGTLAALRLSQPITLAGATTYRALIKTPANPEGVQVTITAAAGTYPAGATLTASGSAGTEISECQTIIGPLGQSLYTQWRITNKHLTDDLRVEIEAVQYDAQIYETVGDPNPGPEPEPVPPSGCLGSGAPYFVPFTDIGGGEGCGYPVFDPPQHVECHRFDESYFFNITGEAAECVTITEYGPSGFTFVVGFGCTGEFCITARAQWGWECCPPGVKPGTIGTCFVLQEFCMMESITCHCVNWDS